MPKYMMKATYTSQGFRALREVSATERLAAFRRAFAAKGVRIEGMYFTPGSQGIGDSFIIIDAPDIGTAMGMVLSRESSGDVRGEVIPLFTVEEMDAALNAF